MSAEAMLKKSVASIVKRLSTLALVLLPHKQPC